MPVLSPNTISTLLTAWESAGLDSKRIGPIIRRAEERVRSLSAQRRAWDMPANRAGIIEALAMGEIDLIAAVLAEHAAAGAGPTQKERGHRLYRDAVNRVCNTAQAELAAIGDALILEHLAPAHDDVIATVTEVAPLVTDIADDAAGAAADPKRRAAWGKLTDAVVEREQLLAAMGALMRSKAIPALPESIASEYRTMRHPELKPRGLSRLHRVHRLIALVDAGTEPGIYTATQAIDAVGE